MKGYLDRIKFLSTTLPYAIKKITELYFAMVNTKHRTAEEMDHKLQNLKGKTKLKL